MSSQIQEQYLRTQINTASPSDLTLMLFNGCLRFIKQAEKFMETKNYEQKNLYIGKATNIISELNLTLDMQFEISHSLRALYQFIYEQLAAANITNNLEGLTEAYDMITELRDTWAEAMKQAKMQEHITR